MADAAEQRRLNYLARLGVDVWVPREPAARTEAAPATAIPVEASSVETASVETASVETAPVDVPPTQPTESSPQPQPQPQPWVAGGSGLTQDWPELAAAVSGCRQCGLCEGRTQTVFGSGARDARLLVVGEAPGADEERLGEPFVGPAGGLLDNMLLAMGLAREQVFIANTLKCRPPRNRDPRPEELRACAPWLQRQVELLQPGLILALGRVAAQSLLASDEPLGRLRGRAHHYGATGIPLLVSYHPAYLLRMPSEKAKAWQDLKRGMALLRREAA
ncbi:uracil-DNA glycosylase [Alkalilimnicola sp. S0819]|uniref:uracil-DNA glycosylase n=1 Tax=Alkalilimnicola sp. S0819 TaxID=2613922 RepID=UPI0012629306|nr:uracil-DNA glycosylase [Alkalilimnicola sp. S0819]KAB7622810.1 uracil-DNA glycosylase [Alkalilimnicola sp. S0819]MPQ17308.1 uracil-DNA glycosylase [Alkalilimnicola sp. S0819]